MLKILCIFVLRLVIYAAVLGSSLVAYLSLNGSDLPPVKQLREAAETIESAARALENFR